jgi:hypothetical protein
MTRSSRTWLPALVLAALAAPAFAAGPNLEGNWKLKEVSNGADTPLALIQIEIKDGKPVTEVLSAPLLGGKLTLDDVKVKDGSIHFSFKVGPRVAVVNADVPKGDDKPKTVRGTIQLGKNLIFAELERTDAKEIERKDLGKQTEATQQLQKARFQIKDAKEKEKVLKEVLDKNMDNAAGLAAAEMLLDLRSREGAVKDDDQRPLAETMLKVAKSYGPAAEKHTLLDVAKAMTRGEKASPLAADYARKAEKALTKEDSAETSVAVLKVLVSALKKSGKADEAKEFVATLTKLEKQLDEEFERTAVPFKVSPIERKGKSSRVALVELFTGAQCPPCVSADIAFDAAVKAYKPSDVVLLEYHEHIPGPDPMTNADSEGRMKFYGKEVRGTPTAFVNGKMTDPLGGYKEHGEARFETLSKIINEALEADAKGGIELGLARKGDNKYEVQAHVTGLKSTGEKVRLRFVLVEDVVHYAGGNGQRLHHHVVRAFPGGLDGFEMKEAKGEQTVLINLADVKKGLTEYLAEADKKRAFLDDDRPLNLKNLKVVAFVQDDDSHEILQAAQVEIPAEK